MPQDADAKRMAAIRRELVHWNVENYSQLPINIKMLLRSIYMKLSNYNKAIIANELQLKYGTGKLLFID